MPKLYYYKSFRYNILMEHAAGDALLYMHGLANVHMQSSLGWDSDTSFTRSLFGTGVVSEAFARWGKWLRNISVLVPWAELRARL
jgi:hypothetical protein